MPAILIDVTRLVFRQFTGRFPTGIDRVCIEYVRYYGPRARAVLTLGPFSAVLSEADSARAFAMVLRPRQGGVALAAWLMAKAVLWRWLRVPPSDGVLFNVSHTGLSNPRYAWALRRGGARLVLMVHDLIPISHPEYCPAGQARKHQGRMTSAARLGQAVVANSRATLTAFTAFCHEQRLAVPPATVALLAPGLVGAAAVELPPLPVGPYFVMLGTIEPRKNHWLLLQVWRRLAERLGTAAPKLVIIGRRGWESENVIDLLERCQALKGVVIELGRCDDAELLRYLLHCRALLYPSMIEGYGLPITEALALGVPVIASDIPVFHEFAGLVPDFADPLDGRHWEELMCDYALPDSALRTAQLQRMGRFEVPTWPAHFSKVDALVAEVRAAA